MQSLERLRLLLVLTAADIRAVGPKMWNGWKAALLRELYYRAEEVLSGGMLAGGAASASTADPGRRRGPAPAVGASPTIGICNSRAAIRPIGWRSTPRPWSRQAEPGAPRRDATASRSPSRTVVDGERSVTEVTIYTADKHGLIARLAGAMAMSGANIVDARIFTLANGMALDSFSIQDAEGGAFDGPSAWRRLAARVELVLSDRLASSASSRASALRGPSAPGSSRWRRRAC